MRHRLWGLVVTMGVIGLFVALIFFSGFVNFEFGQGHGVVLAILVVILMKRIVSPMVSVRH